MSIREPILHLMIYGAMIFSRCIKEMKLVFLIRIDRVITIRDADLKLAKNCALRPVYAD